MAAQLPGARARPTGKLAPQTFQGLSLYLMASEGQLWALETTVFLPDSAAFHEEANRL